MITDIHMHVVPGVDDGAVDLSMSLEMLKAACAQGVRDIFCTSHNTYSEEDIERYKARFMMLQTIARTSCPELKLHTGCELLCAGEYIEDILYGLENGAFLPLGNSKCVLTEFYTDATAQEAIKIVQAMVGAGWKPILAHTERYPGLYDGSTIPQLIEMGAMIQVNLYSLVEESKAETKERARYLVDNGYAHFVGSDAHRSTHRPPQYTKGVEYLSSHCSEDYVQALCRGNAEHFLMDRGD